MNQYRLVQLNRDAYQQSIERLKNDPSIRFATMSLEWWDKQYGWNTNGCLVLTDEENVHLCYIFFKIDKFHDYITIHNMFTPHAQRRYGYAQILLKRIFDLARAQEVKRFRLTSISTSLDFYLSLGLVYWGVNSVGDFYCDLPIPEDGLAGLKAMIRRLSVTELIGAEFATINHKIKDHNLHLTTKQDKIYQGALLKLKTNYLLNDFLKIRERRKIITGPDKRGSI